MSRFSRPCCAAVLGLALCGCAPGPNDAAVCKAYAQMRSGVEVIADGRVVQVFGTRVGPSGPHEGFLLALHSGCRLVVRIETNVAFTGPIPLRNGNAVVVKGEYEYDPSGGVIHFTHRELRGYHASGYVETGGRFYW